LAREAIASAGDGCLAKANLAAESSLPGVRTVYGCVTISPTTVR
jgi:hypothetical protein